MHVNTALLDKGVDVNCALCTAAVLTGQTSGAVNSDLQVSVPRDDKWGTNQSENAFAIYTKTVISAHRKIVQGVGIQDLADQMMGIGHYVASKKKSNCKFKGNPQYKTRGKDVIPFMKRQLKGTEFAVFTSHGGEMYGLEAHWVYAKKDDDSLTFYDYQADKTIVEGSKAVQSDKPLGPNGKVYESAETTYMIAIAFADMLVD